MIPFASQRGGGQDLATHLMNEHDNEYMELADIRGAVADDLHGAFAEWEAQAKAMTKCRNFLYSLSVNPDPAQGGMPRALYDDYIARVEAALGLDGQPRAVVFHIKEDRMGIGREHCHVVWSRIDVQEMKAIHLAYDHDKLMTVTRRFARDHDIELAPGYHRLEDRRRQEYRQLSLYEKAQQDATGLDREERVALVTDLWRQRDTPDAFIQALEYHGYILAEGRRPYVLVDVYGQTNSLPKLIDDKAANTGAIRAFLGDVYANENLPTIEEAKQAAAQHRRALEDHRKSEAHAEQFELLKEQQVERRAKLEREASLLKERQDRETERQSSEQFEQRSVLRSDYLAKVRELRAARDANRPQGLAAFLSKATGMDMIRDRVHRYQDAKRLDAYQIEKTLIEERQAAERLHLQRSQEMKSLDMERQRRGLAQTEERERKSLAMTFQRERNLALRAGHEQMPALHLTLSPPGRPAVLHKAANRFKSGNDGQREAGKRHVSIETPDTRDALQKDFARAAGNPQNRTGAKEGRVDDQKYQHGPSTNPALVIERKAPDDEHGRER